MTGALAPNRVYQFVRVAPSSTLTLTSTTNSSGTTVTLSNAGFLTITTAASQSTAYGGLFLGFCLADVPSYTDFTALFERWKIQMIEFQLWPLNTFSATAGAGGNGYLGVLVHSAIDYNDRSTVTASDNGTNVLRQRPTYRCDQGVRSTPLTWRFRPRAAAATYGAGAFTNYSSIPAPWCDSASPTTEHYGLKLMFEILNPTSSLSYVNFKVGVRFHLAVTDVY